MLATFLALERVVAPNDEKSGHHSSSASMPPSTMRAFIVRTVAEVTCRSKPRESLPWNLPSCRLRRVTRSTDSNIFQKTRSTKHSINKSRTDSLSLAHASGTSCAQ